MTVDPVTGAGGANVWDIDTLLQYARQAGITPSYSIPANIGLDIAVRRSVRVGAEAGLPVEGIGTSADFVYQMTLRDLLGQNQDLVEFAASLLAS